MAFMRPELNPEEIPHDSEKRVYTALRDQLPNDYIVLHSYPWLRPDRDGALREGEADFVIIHRDRGMLILEVKGGELLYQHGHWQRKKSSGYEPITDPFKQARQSMHTLVDRVERHSNGDVLRGHFTYGYAVVFPHDNYEGPAPPGADPVIIITLREMLNLKDAIESAMAQWPRREESMSQHRWNRFTTALLPEFKLYKPISATAELMYEKIQEMTDEQLDVLRGFYEDNPRVYVTGVAGSGKTQLALDRAVNFASSKLKTLFVCYNKNLAEHLDSLVRSGPHHAACGTNLSVRHFHGIARELIQDAQMDWKPPQDDTASDHFFTLVVPDLMEQAFLCLEHPEDCQYDAIVIDEAQDFHKRWWEVLQETLLKNQGHGMLYAFSDPVQRLWEWAPHEPPITFSTHFRLRRNCRNSRWIAKTSTMLAATQTEIFKRSPTGGKPLIDVVPSAAAMKGAVLTAVKKLIQKDNLKPSQIVLIGPRLMDNGSLANTEEIAGVKLTDSIQRWHAGYGILVTTARSFKGLESDVVIVYDLEKISKTFTITDLYVTCTRARSHIHFLVTGQVLATTIRDAIANVQQEFALSTEKTM